MRSTLPHGIAAVIPFPCWVNFILKNALYTAMMERQKVTLPRGICNNLTDEQLDALFQGSIIHEKPLTNALGAGF